jgi:hypothetical protein
MHSTFDSRLGRDEVLLANGPEQDYPRVKDIDGLPKTTTPHEF